MGNRTVSLVSSRFGAIALTLYIDVRENLTLRVKQKYDIAGTCTTTPHTSCGSENLRNKESAGEDFLVNNEQYNCAFNL